MFGQMKLVEYVAENRPHFLVAYGINSESAILYQAEALQLITSSPPHLECYLTFPGVERTGRRPLSS